MCWLTARGKKVEKKSQKVHKTMANLALQKFRPGSSILPSSSFRPEPGKQAAEPQKKLPTLALFPNGSPSGNLCPTGDHFLSNQAQAGLWPAGPGWIVRRVRFSWVNFSGVRESLQRKFKYSLSSMVQLVILINLEMSIILMMLLTTAHIENHWNSEIISIFGALYIYLNL